MPFSTFTSGERYCFITSISTPCGSCYPHSPKNCLVGYITLLRYELRYKLPRYFGKVNHLPDRSSNDTQERGRLHRGPGSLCGSHNRRARIRWWSQFPKPQLRPCSTMDSAASGLTDTVEQIPVQGRHPSSCHENDSHKSRSVLWTRETVISESIWEHRPWVRVE